MRRLIVVFIVIATAGCVAMYGSPEERIAANRAAPDYMLCERLALAHLAPVEVRGEWALELQRRNVDCRQHAQMLNHAVTNQQLHLNNAFSPRPIQSDAPAIRHIQCQNTGVYTNCTQW